ncbi:MAG: O-succinylbenzoate synthase, partial [Propionibacteriaceae bacterium]|nr:O-succinylbenzoate synthase [Propionibacteriaceae bacterium]
VSSALESSIGLRMGLALAAALPALPYACGLNTAALLVNDVVTEPLLAVAGQIELRELTLSESTSWQASVAASASWQTRWEEGTARE